MPEDPHEVAEEAVTATTDSYGGPASDEELAEVYLPEGQDSVATDPAGDGSTASVEPPD